MSVRDNENRAHFDEVFTLLFAFQCVYMAVRTYKTLPEWIVLSCVNVASVPMAFFYCFIAATEKRLKGVLLPIPLLVFSLIFLYRLFTRYSRS